MISSEFYRYEKKFCLSELTCAEVEAIIRLHPAIFSEIYCVRYVNNIYFDSFTLDSYYATVDGINDRIKCRIRWYGDCCGIAEKPILEFKIKKGLLGRKESFPLSSFSLDDRLNRKSLQAVFEKSKLPEAKRVHLSHLQPTLVNRYKRKYFQSVDRNYRITIDTELSYSAWTDFYDISLRKYPISGDNIIVELKYDFEQAHYADTISKHFPFRVTKNSKYVNGVLVSYSL